MIDNIEPLASSLCETYPVVAEVRRLLDEMASLIQQVEAHHARAPSVHLRSLLKPHEAMTRSIMDAIGVALIDFVKARPPPGILAQVRTAVSAQLRAWSRTSPLFYHIFNTPRPALGPYEVFDLLLKNRSSGADVTGHMMDHYYMNMVTATSFRLRNESLTRRLEAEIRRRAVAQQPVRLLSLYAGSAHELRTLTRDRTLRTVMQVTCLDPDASAIRRVKQQLSHQFTRHVSFLRGDPRTITQSRTWPEAPYDLIYALILFDQLSDRQVEPLIAGAYRGLRPGGKLIFGNYATSMPAHEHILIDWVLNLNLRRRSEETLREFFTRTPFRGQNLSFELDPPGASWLVIAERV